MPAQAGIQFTRNCIFWIPAFAGMTDYFRRNSPCAQLNYNLFMRIYINSPGKTDPSVRKTTTEDNTKLLPDFQTKTDTVIAE
jgi:hypothetical protein